MQRGHIFKRHGAWHLRYRVNGKQVCVKLADYNDEYRTKASLRLLAEPYLQPANRGQASNPQTLQHFVEDSYLPHVRTDNEPSTVKGYTDIYEDHIKQRVGGLRVQAFRTVDGQRILDSITTDNPQLTHMTLTHIKSFLSSVFSYARRTGVLNGVNPIQGRGAIVIKGKRSRPTYAYNLDEIEKAIEAVTSERDRAIVATAAFSGLALSEMQGLQWPDVDFETAFITVNRKVWRKHEGETKTEARQAPVPMISPVIIALKTHKEQNAGTTWVFEGRNGPLDIATHGTKKIRPALRKAEVEWHGWHAFRRGLGTNLADLGVQDTIVQDILRHSNVSTTKKFYIKARRAAGVTAMKKLEAVLKGSK
jgi:integrase